MKKVFLLIVLIALLAPCRAQEGMGYYYDYNNHFYAFEKGNNVELEGTRVDSIRAGIDYIAYIDFRTYLRAYYHGETYTLEENKPNAMVATPYSLVYKMQQRLVVFEHGEKKQLTDWAGDFYAGESMIVWQDLPSMDLKAYENGQINTIEKAYSSRVIKNAGIGKNIFAYTDLNNGFKIYYGGQLYETGATHIRNYKCGKNIVAYIDRFNNTFNVFYNYEIKTVSDHLPKSYSVAANMMTYVDFEDNFMLFYNGKTAELESWVPTSNNSKDNIIEYYNNTDLKMIYGGQTYTVDKFIPDQTIIMGPNSALYMDSNQRPKFFYKGKMYENIMNEQVGNMQLIWDLPVFNFGTNTIGFYYNNKLYTYETSRY